MLNFDQACGMHAISMTEFFFYCLGFDFYLICCHGFFSQTVTNTVFFMFPELHMCVVVVVYCFVLKLLVFL